MKLIVTGGGTGGHLYPALAVIESIQSRVPEARIVYAGGQNSLEASVVAERGLPFAAITGRKLEGLLSLRVGGVLLALLRGLREAHRLLSRERPDAVLATGGYVAAATSLAAALRRIPLVMHEQNAIPGRTNRLVARWSKRICVSFEESIRFFPSNRTTVTGLPLREAVRVRTPKTVARRRLELNSERFILLVMGGSQGARRLNELVIDAVQRMAGRIEVLHQTGTRNFEEVQAMAMAAKLAPTSHRPFAYLGDPEAAFAYSAADALFSRCGASTLFEGALHQLPLLMTPLPSAYADHQTANARVFEAAGAGRLVSEASLSGERLAAILEEWRSDSGLRAKMAEASGRLVREDAADRVYKELADVVQ